MMDVFDQTQCSVLATQVVEGPGISAYGVLEGKPVPGSNGKLYEVVSLVEKPRPRRSPVEPRRDRTLHSDSDGF